VNNQHVGHFRPVPCLARRMGALYAALMKKAIAPPLAAPEGTAAQRLAAVNAQLAQAAREGGHPVPTLIAISKMFGADAIRPLIAAGQRAFGENRVQEAAAKWPDLCAETPDIELHLVGQLQSNKATEAVRLFDAIHSVDRSSLVAALARACEAAGRQPDLYAQVNIGDEPQKGGVAIAGLPALLRESAAAGLKVTGLMAVPPSGRDPAPYFALLAKLAARHGLSGLSMGMSGDYDVAARLGATCVRVGSALFGNRTLTQSK
jgi:PLP dependent protein